MSPRLTTGNTRRFATTTPTLFYLSQFAMASPSSTSCPSRVRTLTSPDGTPLWAESSGDVSKPPMVFIHGLSCTALGWDRQFAAANLQRNFHLVRYEMRGHGRSGKPLEERDYASARIAEDFKTVCDAFGLVRPFMVGW